MSKTYGVLIDESSPSDEQGHLWGFELFPDGRGSSDSIEKPMDEIIIAAANYASAPGGAKAGDKHFSWMGPTTFEEPKFLPKDDEGTSINA